MKWTKNLDKIKIEVERNVVLRYAYDHDRGEMVEAEPAWRPGVAFISYLGNRYYGRVLTTVEPWGMPMSFAHYLKSGDCLEISAEKADGLKRNKTRIVIIPDSKSSTMEQAIAKGRFKDSLWISVSQEIFNLLVSISKGEVGDVS